jgi:hypothetical protein
MELSPIAPVWCDAELPQPRAGRTGDRSNLSFRPIAGRQMARAKSQEKQPSLEILTSQTLTKPLVRVLEFP